MSETSVDAVASEAEAAPGPGEPPTGTDEAPAIEPAADPAVPPREGRSVLSLIAYDGIEPPAALTDNEAIDTWCAVSSPWHPALIAAARSLPKVASVDHPPPPEPRQVVVIAGGQADRLPSGYRTQAEDAGTLILEAGASREALVESLRAALGIGTPDAPGDSHETNPIALDFLALGTMNWWVRDLTTAMNHADCLDHESLEREVLSGAKSWSEGDANAAKNRLRAAFELLTQARERYYPVDAYLIDLCLIDPAMPAGVMTDALDTRAPVTFLAPARAIERQAAVDPDTLARLREAIAEGWADVAGGSYAEAEEPLLPLGSRLWQFRKGSAVYRAHLDGRNVESLARRRFGLDPMLPQIARRFGFKFAMHVGFDAGRFPIRPEAKRLWESPDHSNLEALLRPPLAADRPAQGLSLPWKLGRSMRDDHVATLPLVHWPTPLSGWFLDLRRVAAYSPVLARWVTLNDYFHLTDRPYEMFSPEPDEYVTPYLAQAVARGEPRPTSRLAHHTALRARFDGLTTVRAMAQALGIDAPDAPDLAAIEDALETGDHDGARASIDAATPAWGEALARGVLGTGTDGRAGFLIVNPTCVARRAPVLLPEAAPNLRAEGPLRAAQFTDEGVWGVVDLPAFGYAWVPRDATFDPKPSPPNALGVKDRVVHNESISVEFDPNTGGIRSIKAPGEDTARLGQQLVVTGLLDVEGKPASSSMRGETFEVEYAGPALAQVVTTGGILGPDDRRLATFRQRVRLWAGRPLLELDVTLTDLDPDWLATLAKRGSDPWFHYLACRWAWPDGTSMLRRSSLLNATLTEADRPETPDFFDISTRRQRTALLFGGLSHHRRQGTRMLDTLLIAGAESSRSFRLAVALDLEHPFQASTELTAPAIVVPTPAGPPRTGPSGWLFQLDNRGVAVSGVEHLAQVEEGKGPALVFHMLETAGRPVRCRLRTFRNPAWARQTDYQDMVIVDLPIDEDASLVDFTPHELARVEVTLS